MSRVPTYLIYCLRCPFSKEIRYIGQTSVGLAGRLRKHLHDATKRTAHANRWIAKIVRMGAVPEIAVVQAFFQPDHLNEAEKYWISYFRGIGCDLCNTTAGGDNGGLGEEARQRAIELRKHLAKPILASNGEVYRTSRVAAAALGLDHSAITRVANGSSRTHGGMYFTWWSESIDRDAWLAAAKIHLATYCTRAAPMRRAVRDQFGNVYESITALADRLGCDPSDISKAARGIYGSYKGLILTFVEAA